MRLLVWLVRGFAFFTLFAFALNNQHEGTIHWFFGHEWRAPVVMQVIAAVAMGVALGVLGMLPGWWHGSRARKAAAQPAAASTAGTVAASTATGSRPVAPVDASGDPIVLDHPPREGL